MSLTSELSGYIRISDTIIRFPGTTAAETRCSHLSRIPTNPMGTVATTADSHPANAIFGGKAKPKRGVWNFHGTREGNGRGEGREREEDAPRGQDDSAAGRKGAAAAKWRRRRRSARPTPARWGPRAAAAAAMSLRRRCWLSFWSLLFPIIITLSFCSSVRFASGKYEGLQTAALSPQNERLYSFILFCFGSDGSVAVRS
jgi:hypothetical protein